MKKQMAILLAGMLAAALLVNGCAAGEGTPQKVEETESMPAEMNSEAESADKEEESVEETEAESTAAVSESAESRISPAATRQEALDLYDKAFAEHDFAYLLAACIEPYGQQNVVFLAPGGSMSEEAYWGEYDDSQGRYYDIGVFESYSSEITAETQVEDTKAIEEELLQAYGYSCTVEEAYEVTYNRMASGTEGTAVNEGYRAQMVLVDGGWYISKMW